MERATDRDAAVRAALTAHLPPWVAVAVTPVPADEGDHGLGAHPEELAAVAGAVPRRRREFLAGRRCAHAALAALGRDGVPIAVGPGRQPRWPPGVVGSITHAGDLAAAAVADGERAWGLGIDLEPLEPALDPAVDRLVRSDRERGSPGTVVFAVKEAVYKCLHPATGWRLGFGDVTVDADLAAGCFRAAVAASPGSDGRPFGALEGGVAVVAGLVVATMFVPVGWQGWSDPPEAARTAR